MRFTAPAQRRLSARSCRAATLGGMQARMPIDRTPRTPTLGRGWALPAFVLGVALAGSYLPAHGIEGPVDILAATVAALGVAAISVAAPRWARAAVLGRAGRVSVPGSGPLGRATSEASPGRRIGALAVGAAVSAALVALSEALLLRGGLPPAGHAVLLVALYASGAVLLSNLVPLPSWPGWTLLLALLDRRRASDEPTVDRAVPIARGVIAAGAAAVAALAVGAGEWILLLAAALLVWQGWTRTTVALVDDLIGRYLTGRPLGSVVRGLSAVVGPDEPAVAAAARGAGAGMVVAVREGSALLGAIGPRQAAMTPSVRQARCADVMVPVGELELLRPEAPALSALAQLDRFGFALVLEGGPLRYVETNDLLTRVLLAATVAQAVRSGRKAGGDRPSRGGPHREEVS